MMLRFYGHSDDCFMVEGDISDELPGGGDEWVEVEIGDAEKDRRGLVVAGRFGPHGWEFAVRGLGDEPIASPYPTKIIRRHGSSLAVEVDCPEGTPVRCGPMWWNVKPGLDDVRRIVAAVKAGDIEADEAFELLEGV
jgi:hypothetical protein